MFGIFAAGMNKIADFMHDEEMQDDAQTFAWEQQDRSHLFSATQAQQQREWSEKMRSSQYQTAVEDMRKAGLNPALAYQQGGAGVPHGAAATSSGGGSPGPVSRGGDFTAGLVNAAHAEKLVAETDNVKADTRLKLEGQLPELLQRVLTGKASAAELNARKEVLEQEMRMLAEKNKWLPMLQKFEVEKASYDVQEKLAAFKAEYPSIQKLVLEAKLLQLKIPEGLAEAAFWEKEGQAGTYFRHSPRNITQMITGAGGSAARDLQELIQKIFGGK